VFFVVRVSCAHVNILLAKVNPFRLDQC